MAKADTTPVLRVSYQPAAEGISRLRIAVLPFGAHPINRGAELLDESLNGLRVQRKAPLEMRLEWGFGRPRPMPPTAEPMNLDQARPQVARGLPSLRALAHSVGDKDTR